MTDPQTSDLLMTDPQTTDLRLSDAQTTDWMTDPQTSDLRLSDAQTVDLGLDRLALSCQGPSWDGMDRRHVHIDMWEHLHVNKQV